MARDMTKGPVLKTILAFTAPIFAGQILQMTYNIADSIVIGRFAGEGPLAGVAASYTPISFFNALVFGFSIGASIIVSQYFGAREEGKLRRTFSTVYICVITAGIAMTGVVFFLARPLLKYLLNTPEENGVLDTAVLYLRVYYSGALFVFLYNMLAECLRSLGDSLRPLWFLALSCIANIILDLLFVLGFGWGAAGVAAASAVSQGIACLAAVLYIKRNYPVMCYKLREMVFDSAIFRLALKLGIPAALNSCVMSVCFMWQQRFVNSFGTQAMAAFLAGQRVDQLIGIPIIVTGFGLSPFAGQNIGAGQVERVYEGRRKMILLGLCYVLFAAPFLYVFGRSMLSLFVEDPASNVVKYAYDYLVRITPFFLSLCVLSMTKGAMLGAGDTRFVAFISMTDLAGRIGSAYLFTRALGLGLNGVWFASGVGWTISMLTSLGRWYSKRWQTKAITAPKAAAKG